jgi:hypothetical protein
MGRENDTGDDEMGMSDKLTALSPRTATTLLRNCVLLKHGEIFLKGRNRHRFTERLHANLRVALRGIGGSVPGCAVPAVSVSG